jgi:hypothetical protein
MANVDAAFGAKPVRHLTGGVIRATEYKIVKEYAANVFTGDFVKLADTGYVQVGAATNRLLGVFNGCKYTASNGEVVFKRYWPTGTATLGDGDVTAYVYDDPNIVWAIQSSGSADFADIGNLADIVAGAGSTSTGQSGFEINGTTGTGTAQLRILGLYNEPKNAYGTNGVLEAVIWEHELIGHDQGTAGV